MTPILPGDCIYLPSDWVFQSNIVSMDNSLEFKWTPDPWTPDEECGKGHNKRYLPFIMIFKVLTELWEFITL